MWRTRSCVVLSCFILGNGDFVSPFPLKVEKQVPFGTAVYVDDRPLPSWGELVGSNNNLGAMCDPAAPRMHCGEELVCQQGICRHCVENSDCPSMYQCVRTEITGTNLCRRETTMVWNKVLSDPYELWCSVAIFFSSLLAAAAGTGGGGMFVPLFMILTGLKAEAAVPLSQCMIFCGSVMNLLLFVSQRHPSRKEQAKIDYSCVVTFEPMLCLGVTYGVLLHQMSPQWLLLAVLCVVLGLSLWRTARKGVQQAKSEAWWINIFDRQVSSTVADDIGEYVTDVSELVGKNSKQVLGIAMVWIVLLTFSFHGLYVCSWKFFALMLALSVLLCLVSAGAIRWVVKADDSECEGAGADHPLMAFGAGLLGGLLGIGGGMIMSPLLLEMGMHSEAVQATTACFVFLSSSLATIQFALLSRLVWHYALWYSAITVLATLLGQKICTVYVRRRKRYSLITFSIAGVLFFSLVALAFVGCHRVAEDIRSGQQLWFSWTRMCVGDELGIFANDIRTGELWPEDMSTMPVQ